MTDIDICNMALLHIGQTESITAFTDNSAEAKVLNRVYNTALESLLVEFPWIFTVKQAALTEVTTETNQEYSFVYEYPSDCSRVLRILPQPKGTVNSYKPIYTTVTVGETTTKVKRIVCDIDDAYAEYIVNVDDESIFNVKFNEALAYKVATMIARPITQNSGTVNEVQQLYSIALSLAKYYAAREQQQPVNKGNRYMTARR